MWLDVLSSGPNTFPRLINYCGRRRALWLMHLPPGKEVWFPDFAWSLGWWIRAKLFSSTVPLLTQEFKWILWIVREAWKSWEEGGKLAMDWPPIQGGVVILLATPCYGNQSKLWLDWLPSLSTHFTYLKTYQTNLIFILLCLRSNIIIWDKVKKKTSLKSFIPE